jgi:hypothetical protein
MMEYASAQAQAKGVALTLSHEEGHTEATAARPPKAPSLPTTDGVDKIYHELVEIHAIATVQLAECARWRWSNLTPNVSCHRWLARTRHRAHRNKNGFTATN